MLTACDPAPDPAPQPLPWPDTAACEGLDDWPEAWAALELAATDRVAELRDEGFDCGEGGKLGPTTAVRRHPALDCAARVHARDMAQRGYVGNLDPDGADVRDRVDAAGYTPELLVQHVAAGPRDADELLDQTWLPRASPCADLLAPDFTELGLGVFVAEEPAADPIDASQSELGTYWVIVLSR